MILNAVDHGTAGNAVPLVLLHGLFGAAGNFGAIQRRLATDRRVVALDLRNHGASPHAAAMDYAAMAQDVTESLDALAVGPAAILGHSMGGKVAMALALMHPARVERLVIADIAPAQYEPHFRTLARAMQALPVVPGQTRAAADAALAPAIPDAALRGFLLQGFRPGTGWRIGLDQIAAALPAIEDWTVTGRYDGPALCLLGEHSEYVLPEHRPVFRALFPAIKFTTLHGAGHWLHSDAPDAFVAAVQGFMPAV